MYFVIEFCEGGDLFDRPVGPIRITDVESINLNATP